ncbi:Nuclear RNA export factor 2 [Frankliniella fusca]|uniref:Nuclear RNA export factor 2 n=1 Tax=Frankliniella fusca TaxID=407009 RepID=A0AAE1LDP6_9NEOP|nr:Nuclear RNA export factor 2 [Frankliniella fusca]
MAGYWHTNPGITPDIAALLNQALQTAGNRPQYQQAPNHNVMHTLVNHQYQQAPNSNLNSAVPLMSTNIPPPGGTFIGGAPAHVTRTSRTITLPPSLAEKRKTFADRNRMDETNASGSSHTALDNSNQNSSTLLPPSQVGNRFVEDGLLGPPPTGPGLLGQAPTGQVNSNTLAQLPTFDLLAKRSTSNAQPEETPTPVFSTEIGMGKECPKPPEPQTKSVIVLDIHNTHNKLLPHGSHRILHDNDYWHKFIISGPVAGNKTKILKRIVESSEPTLLLPIMYQEEGETAVFYARNCGSAIERLCRNNKLVFEVDKQKFMLRIMLQCAPVNRLKLNALNILKNTMEKRFNVSDRCLDLSSFEHDPDLNASMYCSLSHPSALHYVLVTAVNLPINFVTLRLCHNGIRQLKVEVLMKASFLRTLDLSHNELLYQNDLTGLRDLTQVTKVILDGNPLCAEFRSTEEYISQLKALMPQLRCLDSVALFPGSIWVPKERHFLCSKDGHQMVDQFITHFFDRYDWKDRRCLDGLYHNDALFTLTCVLISGQRTSESSSLTWYNTYNHNIAKLSDISKAEKNVYHGPDEILELFSSLPATEHDPYSFCVDLIHYNDKAAVVSISGIFREHPSSPPDPKYMRSFRRVFALCCTAPNEWQIINEQLHLSNLTSEQIDSAFRIKRPPVKAPVAAWLVHDAQLLSEAEKDQMATIMMQLTTLTKQWATKFLQDNHWYVREALISFVNKFEANELPKDAFSKDI